MRRLRARATEAMTPVTRTPMAGQYQIFQVNTVLGGSMMDERLVRVLIGQDPKAFQS